MSEPAPTAAERCMRILLHAIFDYLDLPDVLRAMCVSDLWREYSLNHPTYYGKLLLTNKDLPGASEAFLLRLSRSRARPVSIFISMDDLRTFMPHIRNHLAHIRSLVLHQLAELDFEPVLDALRGPADILEHLVLYNFNPPQLVPMLSPDFLGNCAPVLGEKHTINVAFPHTLPFSLSGITSLGVAYYPSSSDFNRPPILLVNLFERCPLLRELSLDCVVSLDREAWHARHGWARMSKLTFRGYAAEIWASFQLPLAAVSSITLVSSHPETALALADTLPGPLEVTFPLPERRFREAGGPILFYTAVMRSASHPDNRTRTMKHNVFLRGTDSVFSLPAFTDRIVRLVIPLKFWGSFVRLLHFGPFNALEELTITLTSDATFESGNYQSSLARAYSGSS